jgi:hypothetical protein
MSQQEAISHVLGYCVAAVLRLCCGCVAAVLRLCSLIATLSRSSLPLSSRTPGRGLIGARWWADLDGNGDNVWIRGFRLLGSRGWQCGLMKERASLVVTERTVRVVVAQGSGDVQAA